MPEKNILLIAPTRIGDAVLAASLLRHIHEAHPDARVTIATSPLAAPLFEGFPNLKQIIPVIKKTYNRHWFQVWKRTVTTSWDEVWDVRGSAIPYLLRRKRLRSYVPPKAAQPKVKQYEQAFGVAALPYPILWPTEKDIASAAIRMAPGKRYLVLAPIANWAPKQWPLGHYITLSKQLLEGPCAGYRPMIVCAGHECADAKPLLDALRAYDPFDLTMGDAPLLTIYACMQRAHGFIGNDSGLMHMAAAAGIPTLGLFGPTEAEVYQPWGLKTQALRAPDDDLSKLEPATVAAAFENLLQAA